MFKILILISVFLFIDCAKTSYYTKIPNSKIRMTNVTEDEGYKLKRKFEVYSTRHHMFWGLLILQSKDLERILLDEYAMNKPEEQIVGNLIITETYTFLNSLIEFFLIGIYRPYTVELEGNLYEKIQIEESNQVIEPKTEDIKVKGEEIKVKGAKNVK